MKEDEIRPWHAFYPDGVSPLVEIPSISLYGFFKRTASQYPDEKAVIDGEKTFTYSQLKEVVDRLAAALQYRGFQKGDRLAIMLPNSVEYVISLFATLRLGGIVVQVNPMYTTHELKHILEDSGAIWFVSEGVQGAKLEQTGMAESITFLQVDTLSDESGTFYQWISENHADATNVEITPSEDVALLQYTGGTTGRSKGVMLTHSNLISNVFQNFPVISKQLQIPGERLLGIAPLFHIFGIVTLNRIMMLAGTYIIVRRFKVDQALEVIRQYRPTIFPGMPTLYVALLQHPDLKKDDLSSFKLCQSGTAPLPIEVAQQFKRKTGLNIIEGYGLSEGLVTHGTPTVGAIRVGTIGIPLPECDAKIVDVATGRHELPPGETGELIVKAPSIMKGYWRNPQETEAILKDGWLFTGDLATMGDDGFFSIVGRKKEMIIASGYNVYPSEIEEVLYQHEAVSEACVFGIPDEYRGETVKAVIVRKYPGVTEEEILEWCNHRLARYKVPRIIQFRDELPKSAVGKILRRVLLDEEVRTGGDS
ncbi:long-chain fatty acid--CoA ligase [Bacillus thuringiensis]|nr:long-chain fatty acid--CoA ligase [Bacillus thuringiensis]